MNKVCHKRTRSTDEVLQFTPQVKKLVNEKIVDANDSSKMKQIHAKTIQKLFKGAKYASGTDEAVAGAATADESLSKRKQPYSDVFLLMGNGEIRMQNFTDVMEHIVSLKRQKAKCCDRVTYIQSDCSNCDLPLCEHCGNSCISCSTFLCNSCVLLFGCGTSDCPTCEQCLMLTD